MTYEGIFSFIKQLRSNETGQNLNVKDQNMTLIIILILSTLQAPSKRLKQNIGRKVDQKHDLFQSPKDIEALCLT